MKTVIKTAELNQTLTIKASASPGWVHLQGEGLRCPDTVEVNALDLYHAVKAQVELNKAKKTQ